ncbi:DUF2255 family protein [Streptomyces sp. NPDC096311]|uniref:DUF2255 family protein n=1 Tax=Streptomyces sp. NPDC096311 TaxID=3366083 RepID=UPI0038187294
MRAGGPGVPGPCTSVNTRVDAAYEAKYGRYTGYVEPMVADQARATTLRLTPQDRPQRVLLPSKAPVLPFGASSCPPSPSSEPAPDSGQPSPAGSAAKASTSR